MDWIFQADPDEYDIIERIRDGTDRNWSMNQHRTLVSVGDRVFFWESGPDARLVAIGHVTSPVYQRDENKFGKYAVDIAYDARVEPPLTRSEIVSGAGLLAEYPTFRNFRGTNHPIRDPNIVQELEQRLEGRVIEVAPGSTKPAPVQLESQLDLDHAIKNARRHAARSLGDAVAKMEPTAFEWLVRAVMARLGYVDIEVTKPSNDGGVDLRARLVARGVTNIETAVQAKRTQTVTRPIIQNLRGSLTAHESGLLVTSGQFTQGAEEEAREPTKVPIALIDGPKLIDLMLEFGIGCHERAYKAYILDADSLRLESLKSLAADALDDD